MKPSHIKQNSLIASDIANPIVLHMCCIKENNSMIITAPFSCNQRHIVQRKCSPPHSQNLFTKNIFSQCGNARHGPITDCSSPRNTGHSHH